MANTRKHCQGNVHIHEVKMSFEEWLEGLIEYTADKGRRECVECGEDCECIGINRSQGGLCLKWRCELSHTFVQNVAWSQLQQMYDKAKSTKFVHETVYPYKRKKSATAKKHRFG